MQKTDWKASYDPLIWPHQQTIVAENVLNKSEGGKWRALHRKSIWRGCNSLYMSWRASSSQVYKSDRRGAAFGTNLHVN